MVTHGKAVKTGAAASKAKGKQRASQYKGKQAAAAKAASKLKNRVIDSLDHEEEEGEKAGEEEGEEKGEEEGEEEAEEEGEGEGEGDDAEMVDGEIEKGIYTVKRLLAEERADGAYYLVDGEGWSIDEAGKEVRECEEVLAAMPKLDAFNLKPESRCCLGKLCCHPQLDADGAWPSSGKCALCGNEHRHICAT